MVEEDCLVKPRGCCGRPSMPLLAPPLSCQEAVVSGCRRTKRRRQQRKRAWSRLVAFQRCGWPPGLGPDDGTAVVSCGSKEKHEEELVESHAGVRPMESGRNWDAALPARIKRVLPVQNQKDNAELELNEGMNTSEMEDAMCWDANGPLGNGTASRSMDLPTAATKTESRAGDWEPNLNGTTEDRAFSSTKSLSDFPGDWQMVRNDATEDKDTFSTTSNLDAFGSTGDWQVIRNDATEHKDTFSTKGNLDAFGSTGAWQDNWGDTTAKPAWQDNWGDATAKPASDTIIKLDLLSERGQNSDARLAVESRRSYFQDAAEATLHIRCPFSVARSGCSGSWNPMPIREFLQIVSPMRVAVTGEYSYKGNDIADYKITLGDMDNADKPLLCILDAPYQMMALSEVLAHLSSIASTKRGASVQQLQEEVLKAGKLVRGADLTQAVAKLEKKGYVTCRGKEMYLT